MIKKFLEHIQKRDDILVNVSNYLEYLQPISKENGFIQCLYHSEDNSNLFFFQFDSDIEEDYIEKFFDFLDKNKIKYITSFLDSYDSFVERKVDEYTVELTDYQIKKYTDLKKYNL